jgi:hypothetical protein
MTICRRFSHKKPQKTQKAQRDKARVDALFSLSVFVPLVSFVPFAVKASSRLSLRMSFIVNRNELFHRHVRIDLRSRKPGMA